ERSHDTVPAASCLVAHSSLRGVLGDVRLTPGLELTLRVSAATGEMTALWDPNAGAVEGLPRWCRRGPRAYLTEYVDGVALRVSAASFFQSGRAAADLLVDAVRRAAPE